MPELRRDPIVGRWVIISTERGKRPSDFGQIKPARRTGFCPFCPGNESKTPPEVYAFRENGSLPNSAGWLVRVVSNKFPALQIEGTLDRRAEGIYDKMNGVGAHEVLIETPEHEAELSELPRDQIVLILKAIRARMLDLARDRRFRYIQIFKNHGEAAGASLEHSHIQLIATPIVPRRVVEELNGCASHFELKERCIVCDIVDQEMEILKRVVCNNEEFLSIEPFAPRFPFETWVVPTHHASNFESMDDELLEEFAQVLKESLQRINLALNKPPYNFVLHTSPCNDWKDTHTYHWHLEIIPKLTKVAGFEWGTGFYINPTPPEAAAQFLREVVLEGKNGDAAARSAPPAGFVGAWAPAPAEDAEARADAESGQGAESAPAAAPESETAPAAPATAAGATPPGTAAEAGPAPAEAGPTVAGGDGSAPEAAPEPVRPAESGAPQKTRPEADPAGPRK